MSRCCTGRMECVEHRSELTSVNMENFITGYAGHEYQVRAELRKRLGEEKYEYFFDKVSSQAVVTNLSSSSTSSPKTMRSYLSSWD
jgi:hypothetical protein